MRCLLNKYCQLFIATVFVLLSFSSCQKGGEPTPYMDGLSVTSENGSNQKIVDPNNNSGNAGHGDIQGTGDPGDEGGIGGGNVIGGDDNEDDDDNDNALGGDDLGSGNGDNGVRPGDDLDGGDGGTLPTGNGGN